MASSNVDSSISEIVEQRSDDPDVDPDAEVFIKAESHYSRQDLKQELALIRTGEFDAVMFEAAREDAEEISQSSLFDWIVGLVFFLMNPLYTNSTPLLAAAGRTGTTPYYTREQNGDVIQELGAPLPGLIAALWILCLSLTALFGALEGGTEFAGLQASYTSLSLFFFISALGIPVLVRIMRNKIRGGLNRNTVIAEKVTNANAKSGRILVILGHKHADRVKDEMPDGINVSSIPVTHTLISREGIKVFVPGVVKLILLFTAIWLLVTTVGGIVLVILLSAIV